MQGNPLEIQESHLREAKLSKANLRQCQLVGANLESADLSDADLSGANLTGANLKGAKLDRANLRGASLLEANFSEASLIGCRVYGVSAWSVALDNASQKDIVISDDDEPVVTVDDVEVAQFIYLMLNNARIRAVIDNITAKGVLILGRFADPARKAVLDGLRDRLRTLDLLPMVFDFDRPTDKDYTETIQTLAGLCMFVIADITNPKSTPLELEALVKQFKIPYLPIIDTSVDTQPFAMLVDLQKSFPWVLGVFGYWGSDQLFGDGVIEKYLVKRATAKRDELRKQKADVPKMLEIGDA